MLSTNRAAGVGTCAAVLVFFAAACGGGGDDGGGQGPIVATRVEITPSVTTLQDCMQSTLQAAAFNAQDQPVAGVNFTFSSSNSSVLQVSGTGTMTGAGAGTAFARVSAGSLADSVAITVTDSLRLSVGDRMPDLAIGAQYTLQVSLLDCRGAVRAGVVTFTTLDAGVVTAQGAGILNGIAAGQTWVRIAAGGLLDSADVAVVSHPAGVLGTPTPVAGGPFGVAVSRTGPVIAALLTAAQVAVLPPTGGSHTLIAAQLNPTDVAFSRDGASAFVANQGGGTLGRLNVAGGTQTTAHPIGFSPFRVRVSRDGTRVFVAGNGGGVAVMNRATGAPITSYTMQADQNGLAETQDGSHLYVSSMSFGVVREVTTATGVVGRSFAIGGTAQEVVLSSNDALLFVAVESSDFVQVWNLASGTKIDSIDVGAGTFGMALSPDGQRLYATSVGVVTIIDAAARTVLSTVPVGGNPRRVAFNRPGTRAIVANESGWVDFIN